MYKRLEISNIHEILKNPHKINSSPCPPYTLALVPYQLHIHVVEPFLDYASTSMLSTPSSNMHIILHLKMYRLSAMHLINMLDGGALNNWLRPLCVSTTDDSIPSCISTILSPSRTLMYNINPTDLRCGWNVGWRDRREWIKLMYL